MYIKPSGVVKEFLLKAGLAVEAEEGFTLDDKQQARYDAALSEAPNAVPHLNEEEQSAWATVAAVSHPGKRDIPSGPADASGEIATTADSTKRAVYRIARVVSGLESAVEELPAASEALKTISRRAMESVQQTEIAISDSERSIMAANRHIETLVKSTGQHSAMLAAHLQDYMQQTDDHCAAAISQLKRTMSDSVSVCQQMKGVVEEANKVVLTFPAGPIVVTQPQPKWVPFAEVAWKIIVAALLLWICARPAHAQFTQVDLKRIGGTVLSGANVIDTGNNAIKVNVVAGGGGGGAVTQSGTWVVGQSGSWNVGLLAGAALVGKFTISQGGNDATVTGAGALNVSCSAGCAGSTFADDDAFTASTTPIAIAGAVYDDAVADPTTGSAAAPRLTVKRGLHINLRNNAGTEVGTAGAALRVDPTGGTAQPVTGTFWQATQPVSGTFWQATQPVSGTFWQATQPVSAASLPLPTGASTAAKQPALGTAGTASADVITVQGIAAMTPLLVDGSGATQPVSGTVAATQSGTWNVTNVSGTVSLPTGASTLAEQQTQTTALQLIDDTVATTGSAITAKGVTAVGTDGANGRALKTDTGGELQVDVLTVPTITVNSHAVTNAGTFAVQVDGSALTALQLIDDPVATTASAIPAKGMAASGTDGTNARILKTDTGGELQVDVLTLPAVTNAGTFAVQVDGSALTSLQLIDDAIATTASAITTKGIAASGTDGTNARVLKTDTSGELQVDVLTVPSITVGTFPDNEPFNVAQINGVTPLMGAGNTGTGSQRVTLATDNAAIATWGHGAIGAAPSANATQISGPTSGATGGLSAAVPVCTEFFNINQTAGTQLITGVSGRRVYICSFNVVAAAAQNIALVAGTGTVCATTTVAVPGTSGGTTAATGWNLAANSGIVLGGGFGAIGKTTVNADNVCLLQSGSAQLSGGGSYAIY